MGEYDFVYVHTDIPEGMTIRDWRAARARRTVETRDAERRQRRDNRRAMLATSARRVARVLGGRPTMAAPSVRRERPVSP
jgi:hypothetical protein